ncbi:TPA: hypothetical protein PXN07_000004 [Yersinia enterocolitica]|nr:hypothetical protein [Yersinia enterocolitica]
MNNIKEIIVSLKTRVALAELIGPDEMIVSASDLSALIAQLEAAQKEISELREEEQEWLSLADMHEHLNHQNNLNVEHRNKIHDLKEKLLAAEAELSAANEKPIAPVILEIANERLRQINAEGWAPEHDDQHANGELAMAACEYAKQAAVAPWDEDIDYDQHPSGKFWPWDESCWKPTTPRRDLVKAGALIVAELERLDRESKRVEGNADAE